MDTAAAAAEAAALRVAATSGVTAVAALTFLSPGAALVGVVTAALLVGAIIYGSSRVQQVQRVLGLAPPPPTRRRIRLSLAAAFAAVLALAAAQPVLTHDSRVRVRRDVEALFIIDVSRSMQASARPGAPTRLDRARAAAIDLRGSVPNVAAGVATLTDRVLPDLFPVSDRQGFENVVESSVQIESPPPQASAVRATSYAALGGIPGHGYFAPQASSRIVIVLTDGESLPVESAALAAAYAGLPAYHVLIVRFWHAKEKIYDEGGRVESAYRPDSASGAIVTEVASALGGSAYDERALDRARAELEHLVGTGPTTTGTGSVRQRTPLAPGIAVVALVLAAILGGTSTRRRQA